MAKRAGAAPDDEETGPTRTCVATRAVRPVGELIRFAVSPDGVLTPDIRARLPGRGVWTDARRAAVAEAVRRKAFARALKRPVDVPADLPALVERLLAEDARQFLSLANKAGQVVMGFSKVEAVLAGGGAMVLLSASDGAEDGRRKLIQAARRHAGGGGGPRAARTFSSRELDLALGRENAIHAAVLAGPAGAAFLTRLDRLERFRSDGHGEARPDAEDQSASTGPFALETDKP
jgi:predicted RNA-binding protein YlxR (DUF448 family)